MKEAVDDIMVTLNEAASEVGMVGGMVESIAEAMAKVSTAAETLAMDVTFPLGSNRLPLTSSFKRLNCLLHQVQSFSAHKLSHLLHVEVPLKDPKVLT